MGNSQLQSTTASYGQFGQILYIQFTGHYSPPYTGKYPPELHVLHGVNAGHKSQDLLQIMGRERATIGIADQRTACEATQGIKIIE